MLPYLLYVSAVLHAVRCLSYEPNRKWKIQSYICSLMSDAGIARPDEIRELANNIITMPKPMLIHSAQGHGRTGLIASTVSLVSGNAQTAAEAIKMVQTIRPGVELNSTHDLPWR